MKWSSKFKKGYKLAKKRGLDIGLLENDVLTLILVDTGKSDISVTWEIAVTIDFTAFVILLSMNSGDFI